MSIIYKIDILQSLADAGYTTYKIRKNKVFAEGTVQAFRQRKMISMENLDKLCKLLNCQPGDLLEYVPDDSSA